MREVIGRPWPAGTIVRVLSVVQPYVPPAAEYIPGAATLDDLRDEHVRIAQQLATSVAAELVSAEIQAESAVRVGDARSAIIDDAEEWNADLIVVGSHGRTGLKRWLLGSVAQAVVSHAPCSVEVVRTRRVGPGADAGRGEEG